MPPSGACRASSCNAGCASGLSVSSATGEWPFAVVPWPYEELHASAAKTAAMKRMPRFVPAWQSKFPCAFKSGAAWVVEQAPCPDGVYWCFKWFPLSNRHEPDYWCCKAIGRIATEYAITGFVLKGASKNASVEVKSIVRHVGCLPKRLLLGSGVTLARAKLPDFPSYPDKTIVGLSMFQSPALSTFGSAQNSLDEVRRPNHQAFFALGPQAAWVVSRLKELKALSGWNNAFVSRSLYKDKQFKCQ
jgi:hypothetical protein